MYVLLQCFTPSRVPTASPCVWESIRQKSTTFADLNAIVAHSVIEVIAPKFSDIIVRFIVKIFIDA